MHTLLTGPDPADPSCAAAGPAHKQGKLQHHGPKRFYKDVSIVPEGAGFAVLLDGRKVTTPAQRVLVLPNKALAKLAADEFNLQDKVVDPAGMPVTRLANTVIDALAGNMQPVIEDILRFATADLLFYRAESPRELARRQSEQWDPVLDWAARVMAAHFVTGQGVMHIEQPAGAIAALSLYLRKFPSPFALAALHVITALTGSALIALAIAAGEIDVAAGWRLAHLDEDWNRQQWGKDGPAQERRRHGKDELYAAAAVLAAA